MLSRVCTFAAQLPLKWMTSLARIIPFKYQLTGEARTLAPFTDSIILLACWELISCCELTIRVFLLKSLMWEHFS